MLWVLSILVLLLAYTYGGYPAVIWLLARSREKPVAKGSFGGGVSVLIAAHNEAAALPQKLESLLELAKSEPIREIWIGLDGCTDGTGERVQAALEHRLETGDWRLETRDQSLETRDQRLGIGDQSLKSVVCSLKSVLSLKSGPAVHLLEFERQRGKAAVLNDLMAKASQPISVMMDSRQRVEAGAISMLLENFADPQVGVVSGALVYETADGGAQKGAESYWGYEKFIRRCESRYWAVPGATGALYAIRRELCAPIPENTLVDDVLIPMRAVLKGFRCLFEPSAQVFDLPSVRFDQEGLRKRRTLAGIWQLWRLEPRIFSPFTNPIWFQWISHKFLRLLTPFLMMAAFIAVGMMGWWNDGRAGILFYGLVAGIGASGMAYWTGRRIHSRAWGLFGAFFGVNWALLQAAGDAWTGRFEARWKGRGEQKTRDRSL